MSPRTLFPLMLGAASLWAQSSASLSGPTSGFVFDEQSRSLRVVVGVPGAAYLGQPIASDLDFATVSPDSRLAVTLHGGQLALLRLETGETTPLGDSAGIELAAWTDDSSAVALAGSNYAIFRKLKSSRESLALVNFSTKVRAIATNGSAIFAAAEDGVYWIDTSEARLVAALEDVTALALRGGTLYATSKTRQQVVTVRNWTESAEIAILASGIEDPSGLALSPDGSVLFAADRASKSLVALNAASGESLGRLELDFEPSRADRLSSGLFLLNSRASAQDPIQVLDSSRRAVFFVPTQDLSSQSPVPVED